MIADDRIPVASDRALDRDGPGAVLAHRKDGNGRVGADRIAAESTAVATLAGGMVLGAFYPAEAKAALHGGTAAPPAPDGKDDRPAETHGEANHAQANVPEAASVIHDAAALIQAEGDALIARLEAAFDDAMAGIGAPTFPAGHGDAAIEAPAADGSAPVLPDGAAHPSGSAGEPTDGLNAIQREVSDAILGDHPSLSGPLGSAGTLVPSVAGIGDGVAYSLNSAVSALPSGLDPLLGSVKGPVAALADGLTAPLQVVTDASGDILAPAADLAQVAGDIAAPVLGHVSDLASAPVTAAASLVSGVPAVATSLVEGPVGGAADHGSTSVATDVDGAVLPAAMPLDLPSLNLGFLGQSYSDLGHGEVGPHHDQGLLHGLV